MSMALKKHVNIQNIFTVYIHSLKIIDMDCHTVTFEISILLKLISIITRLWVLICHGLVLGYNLTK